MIKFSHWFLVGCLAFSAAPSLCDPVEVEYIFSAYRFNNSGNSTVVGLEMDTLNGTASLVSGLTVYPFGKKPTLIEYPNDAKPSLGGPTSIQIIPGKSRSFILIFGDGEVVSMTESGSPYSFKIPELAGRHRLTIHRGISNFSDLLFAVEDEDRGLYFAFYAGVAYRMSGSLRLAVDAGIKVQPVMNDAGMEWAGLMGDGVVYALLTKITQGSGVMGRPMETREINRWNRQLDHLRGIGTQKEVLPVGGSGIASANAADGVVYKFKKGRYSIVRANDDLEILDRDANQAHVASIPLLAQDFWISETEKSLLIHYKSEHRTDAFEIGSFEHLRPISFCVEKLSNKYTKGWDKKVKGERR